MAKIQTVKKSRKETKCGKCGKIIPVGSPYVYAEPAFRPRIVRCTSCGLKPYEVSSSEYVQTIGSLKDNWMTDCGCDEDGIQSVSSTLDELKSELECRLDNMPEQLQECDSGLILQERIDALDDAINELDSIDLESLKAEATEEVSGDFLISELVSYYGEDVELKGYDISGGYEEDETATLSFSELPGDEDYDTIVEGTLPYVSEYDISELVSEFEGKVGDAVSEILDTLDV